MLNKRLQPGLSCSQREWLQFQKKINPVLSFITTGRSNKKKTLNSTSKIIILQATWDSSYRKSEENAQDASEMQYSSSGTFLKNYPTGKHLGLLVDLSGSCICALAKLPISQ